MIGAEANFGWAKETAVLHGSAYPGNLLFGSPSLPFGASNQDIFRVTTNWDGSIALRVGRLLTPSTLLYVSGGLAWANIQVSSNCSHVPTANVSNCAPGNYFSGTLGPEVVEQSATALGWTGGIGLENDSGPIGSLEDSIACPGSLECLYLCDHANLHWLPFCREQPAECLFSGADDAAFFRVRDRIQVRIIMSLQLPVIDIVALDS